MQQQLEYGVWSIYKIRNIRMHLVKSIYGVCGIDVPSDSDKSCNNIPTALSYA
ncbi:predicted protein [Botrytis cinerea T4]|uniref:Uncharacterized protein n=1 Tax=Botryotinia fuckeliana (strain T4) TaxID=999810 RepID=G2YWY4_BOTF4|nr:predicted protein [Botrytis cinerea T4]